MPMRQLRNCDFCGGDAAGVYEVLPPELSPTEAEQRRVVLCPDCAGTLETVVDPLLERLGVGTGDGASADDAGEPGGRSAASEASAAGDPGADAGSDDSGESPADDSASGGGPGGGVIQWDDSGPAGDDESDDPEHPGSDRVRNGIPGTDLSDDTGRRDDSDPAPTGAGTGTGKPAASGPDGPDADGTDVGVDGTDDDVGGTDDDASGDSTAGGDDPSSGDEPEEFRTVMRLLGNREFPVERDAIVELAASAYELDERHVHGIIDYAVDRGVIADEGGTLRRD